MQKIYWLMLGLLSITGTLCAQQSGLTGSSADKVFELPSHGIHKRFCFDLGKGNRLFIETEAMSDLERFSNIDSLLLVFIGDMKAFRDSLSDPLTIKRIDYSVDLSGRKRIRILQSRAPGSSFLLDKGDLASLKLEQDTIHIQSVSAAPAGGSAGQTGGIRYDRLTLFINQYSELESYITTGLNDKVRLLLKNIRGNHLGYNWTPRDGIFYMDADPSVSTASMHVGERTSPQGNQLLISLLTSVNVQNYTNYFTPSFALGLKVGIGHRNQLHSFTFNWEPFFFFPTDAQGRQQTVRNDFLVFGYMFKRRDQTEGEKPNRVFAIGPDFTLGWLINREGAYFEKHHFRFSAARVNLFHNYIYAEPCIYFHDFLRGVTPGIRLSFGALF